MSESQDFKNQYLSDWAFASSVVFTHEELSALSQVMDETTINALAVMEYDSNLFVNARHKQEFWPDRLTAKEICELKERAHKIMALGDPKV